MVHWRMRYPSLQLEEYLADARQLYCQSGCKIQHCSDEQISSSTAARWEHWPECRRAGRSAHEALLGTSRITSLHICNGLGFAKIHSATSWVRISLPPVLIPHTYIKLHSLIASNTMQSSSSHTVTILTYTRPDVAQTHSEPSRYLQNPGQKQINAAYHA
jgi:hypothetical protein